LGSGPESSRLVTKMRYLGHGWAVVGLRETTDLSVPGVRRGPHKRPGSRTKGRSFTGAANVRGVAGTRDKKDLREKRLWEVRGGFRTLRRLAADAWVTGIKRKGQKRDSRASPVGQGSFVGELHQGKRKAKEWTTIFSGRTIVK